MAAALGQLADFAYRVPYMMGLGQQWPLAEPEARAMGKALEGALKALPGKSKQNAVKVLSKWLPWVSLFTTGYIITMPRVMQTQMFRGANRVSRTPAQGVDGPIDEIRGGAGQPDRDGGRVPTWEDYRRNER